ncbi:sulfatase [Ulvibacterium sp.]|uniref:sulfatase n=1 Tax=Ulvibacterium sp. TaxID=2665914 RepID=UPI003CC68979
MNRDLIYGTLICITVMLYASCKDTPVESEAPPSGENPNVLFIAIDDLNDWVGCLKGHPQVRTPNIDRLASRGILFTNAHSQSPICNPSRTSILTGYRPSTNGVYGLSPSIRDVPELKDIVTLPQYFSKHGYTTFSAGKIFHGGYGRRDTDAEFDSLGPGSRVKTKPSSKIIGTTPGGNNPLMDWGKFPLKGEETSDWEVASWAVDVLNGGPESPYFLSVGFFLPHVPLYSPEEWYDLYPMENLQLPPILENDREDTPRSSWYNHWDVPEPRLKWTLENGQHKNLVQAYLAAVSFVDSQVGRVLDALEANGQAKNTIVILWSDHGYHLGEKEITGKNTLWERSTRVPLIFAGPNIAEGGTYDYPVELLDVYPTLNGLCGLPQKTDLEGHSLLPQLGNPDTQRPWPAITTNNWNNHTIRTKDWRYIRYADGSEELYNMKKDPNEWYNVISDGKHNSIVDSLRRWLPETNTLPHVGNYLRILEYRDGQPFWQGKSILSEDPIPGI